jgi:ABC-type transporter MlaC component|tara:strand:- start:207 stop:788 length:582 start_codon:yes stop_codon:yes gene_type:complete
MIKNVFKKIFLLAFIFLNQAFAEDLEITNWFNQESKQFLEIMNNADVENHYNYEKYKKFVENNFAVKSIAFGLLNENIMNETDEITLNKYVNTFKSHLTKTIYNLANSNTSGDIELKDIDIKDGIYIINSDIFDKNSSISLYWKVVKVNDSYKILDVIVENTSYFVTKKSEFTKILRKSRGNLDSLIDEINKL